MAGGAGNVGRSGHGRVGAQRPGELAHWRRNTSHVDVGMCRGDIGRAKGEGERVKSVKEPIDRDEVEEAKTSFKLEELEDRGLKMSRRWMLAVNEEAKRGTKQEVRRKGGER